VAVYRQYNPNAVAGAHNFTTLKAENDNLASIGWYAEGVGWYAVDADYSTTDAYGKTGYQNPSWMYHVSPRDVTGSWRLGHGIFSYASSSRISANASREDVVNAFIQRATEYVGKPYVWDYACAPEVGVDCAGRVLQCGYAVGMDFGEMNPYNHYYGGGWNAAYANAFWNSSHVERLNISSRQLGDLISWAGHVAIYIGNDTVIEAWTPSTGVRYANMWGDGHGSIRGVIRLFS
jgi:cell wall-associated NlpC family hydrolase